MRRATLPDWPGRLPLGLTQLVLAPIHILNTDHRVNTCPAFLRTHLLPLQNLAHLAFHNLPEIGGKFLLEVCAVAGALPQLISLHLVCILIAPISCTLCASSAGKQIRGMSECSSVDLCNTSINGRVLSVTTCQFVGGLQHSIRATSNVRAAALAAAQFVAQLVSGA